jgi:hypothetical protein
MLRHSANRNLVLFWVQYLLPLNFVYFKVRRTVGKLNFFSFSLGSVLCIDLTSTELNSGLNSPLIRRTFYFCWMRITVLQTNLISSCRRLFPPSVIQTWFNFCNTYKHWRTACSQIVLYYAVFLKY